MRFPSTVRGLALAAFLASGVGLALARPAGAVVNSGAFNRQASPPPDRAGDAAPGAKADVPAPAPRVPAEPAPQVAPALPSASPSTRPTTSGQRLFVLTLATGALAPAHYEREQIAIERDGRWVATRGYPYRQPAQAARLLGRGRLDPARLHALVSLALKPGSAAAPGLLELPAESNDHTLGSGTASLDLVVRGQPRHLAVVGRRPAAFQAFARAIADATVGRAKLAPLLD